MHRIDGGLVMFQANPEFGGARTRAFAVRDGSKAVTTMALGVFAVFIQERFQLQLKHALTGGTRLDGQKKMVNFRKI